MDFIIQIHVANAMEERIANVKGILLHAFGFLHINLQKNTTNLIVLVRAMIKMD
jgi:hypothetical protein